MVVMISLLLIIAHLCTLSPISSLYHLDVYPLRGYPPWVDIEVVYVIASQNLQIQGNTSRFYHFLFHLIVRLNT
jgi:hypothetical protein